MPIVVQHQPAASVVADAAWQGGYGQYQQRQFQNALNVAELAQRDIQQRRAIEADMVQRQQQQAFAAEQAGINRAFQVGEMQLGAQLDLERGAQQQQWNLDAQDNQAGNLWQRENAIAAEEMANQVMGGLAKSQPDMTPEGQRIYADLAGKFRAIQNGRGEYRPQQFASLMGQFADEVNRSGIQGHINPPKPLAEQFASEVFEIPGKGLFAKDRNATWRQVHKEVGAGEIQGPLPEHFANSTITIPGEGRYYIGPDGQPKQIHKYDAEAERKKTAAVPKSFAEHFADFTDFREALNEEAKRLTAERKATAGEDTAPKAATLDEAYESLEAAYKLHIKNVQEKKPQPITDTLSPPAAEQTPAPVPAQPEVVPPADFFGGAEPSELADAVVSPLTSWDEVTPPGGEQIARPVVESAEPVKMSGDDEKDDEAFAKLPVGALFLDTSGRGRIKPPPKDKIEQPKQKQASSQKRLGAIVRKPTDVRNERYERDTNGLLTKAIEEYTDSDTGERVQVERTIVRDPATGMIASTETRILRADGTSVLM